MVKRRVVLLLSVIAMMLSGCQKTGMSEETTHVSESGKAVEIEESEENQAKLEKKDNIKEKGLKGDGAGDAQREALHDGLRGGQIQEDEQFRYICSDYYIYQVDKESNEATLLWRAEDSSWIQRAFNQGAALLVGDRIYFFETKWGVMSDEKILSVIRTDGTGYQQLLTGLDYGTTTLYLQGHRLYLVSYDKEVCYELMADGTIGKEMPTTSFPEGYSPVYYTDGGEQYLSSVESIERYGYVLAKDEENRVCAIRQNGEVKRLQEEGSLCTLGDRYFVIMDYDDDLLRVVDAKTFETKVLLEGERVSLYMVLGMDDDYVYYADSKTEWEETFVWVNKIAIADGEVTELFTVKEDGVEKRHYDTKYGLLTYRAEDGMIYYVDGFDYQLYVMGRAVERPEEAIQLTPAFYDSGVAQVGEIESCVQRWYSDTMPDELLMEVELEQLVVDKRYAGAEKINQYLQGEMDADIAYGEETAKWQEETIVEEGDNTGLCGYSLSSTVSDMYYLDENYVSFYQSSYVYLGGAHGMPYHIGYTFDLHTGEMLTLSDIVGNSETELKEIVTKHFAEYINTDPESFWENAVDTVRECTDMDSMFYLTEDGIVFYFEPYALACYAAGFQEVIIPYEEFDMKISLSALED